jgi:hypothetical protein
MEVIMARKTPQQVFDKYKKNMGNATADIKIGVQTTDKDQAERAIKAIPKMKAKVVEAIDNGSVEAGLKRSGRKGWEDGMLGKGINNIMPGIEQKKAKIMDAMEGVVENAANVVKATEDMPKNNLEEGLQKVRVAAETTQAYWKRRKGIS